MKKWFVPLTGEAEVPLMRACDSIMTLTSSTEIVCLLLPSVMLPSREGRCVVILHPQHLA